MAEEATVKPYVCYTVTLANVQEIPHKYTPVGEAYRKKKDIGKNTEYDPMKSYQIIFCTQCGKTVELVVADENPRF